MKKIITALASAACLLCATTAHAGIYKFDFNASDFGPDAYTGVSAPQASLSGSITFTAESLNATITAINAVDLTIAGHVYSVQEIYAYPLAFNNFFLIGGVASGVGVVSENTNDFFLTDYDLEYSVLGTPGFWSSNNFSFSVSEVAAEVPEPSSLALLLAGVGGLGTLLRRRRCHA